MRRRGVLTFACAALLGLFSASAAQGASVTFGFTHIVEPGDGAQQLADGATGEAQFSVVVSDSPGSGKVSFKFLNTLSPNPALADSGARIDGVYFDDGTLLGIASIVEGPGVQFSQGASPSNLSGGNQLSPPFVTTADFSADAHPGAKNGVHAGEWVEVIFNLTNGQQYADVLNAFTLGGATGGLRIGIKAQGFSGGGSETFVNNGPPPGVPLPASVWTGLALLGALGGWKLRPRKA
jgi:hypothetical protein